MISKERGRTRNAKKRRIKIKCVPASSRLCLSKTLMGTAKTHESLSQLRKWSAPSLWIQERRTPRSKQQTTKDNLVNLTKRHCGILTPNNS